MILGFEHGTHTSNVALINVNFCMVTLKFFEPR